MKYANTVMQNGAEIVVTVLPLEIVPGFDPNNPPQPSTYGVPDEVQVGWEKQLDGSFAPHVPTAAEIIAQKKLERQVLVDAITVTVSTGKIFDGNEEAQSRMSRAIQAAQIASIPTTTWVLTNNVPTPVTLAELQEALVLSIQAMGAVWSAPYL